MTRRVGGERVCLFAAHIASARAAVVGHALAAVGGGKTGAAMANSTSKPPKHDFAPAWLKVPDKEAPQTPRVRTSHAAGRRRSLADHVDARRSPCHTSVEQT